MWALMIPQIQIYMIYIYTYICIYIQIYIYICICILFLLFHLYVYVYTHIHRPLGRVEVLCSPSGEARVRETLGPRDPQPRAT